MKHPTPSDFLVEVKEAYVSVIFKPSDSHYSFGRLADPEDIARYGPLSQSPNAREGKTRDTASIHRTRSHAWRTPWPSRRSQPLSPWHARLDFPSMVAKRKDGNAVRSDQSTLRADHQNRTTL